MRAVAEERGRNVRVEFVEEIEDLLVGDRACAEDRPVAVEVREARVDHWLAMPEVFEQFELADRAHTGREFDWIHRSPGGVDLE